MSGFHHSVNADHSDPHHHNPRGPKTILVPTRSRRAFLGDFGRGTLAMAVFTPLLVACGSDADPEAEAQNADDSTPSPDTTVGADGSGTTQAAQQEGDADTTDGAPEDLRWARANLGFVSAYVLARGNSAAIVDTGGAGSADAIGATLQTLGLGYQDVDHVILTHRHGDHIGSINEVLANTPTASVYAGEADLGQINIDDGAGFDPNMIVALSGGEDVFGFETIATPGHTAGHMAVIDHTAGILVAGDAIFTEGGAVVEGPPRFFDDIDQSRQSIAKLAALSFNTLLIGHGDPIESAADAAVQALASALP